MVQGPLTFMITVRLLIAMKWWHLNNWRIWHFCPRVSFCTWQKGGLWEEQSTANTLLLKIQSMVLYQVCKSLLSTISNSALKPLQSLCVVHGCGCLTLDRDEQWWWQWLPWTPGSHSSFSWRQQGQTLGRSHPETQGKWSILQKSHLS